MIRTLVRVVVLVVVALFSLFLVLSGLVVYVWWTTPGRQLGDRFEPVPRALAVPPFVSSPQWSSSGGHITFGVTTGEMLHDRKTLIERGEIYTIDVAKMRLLVIDGSGNNDVASPPSISPDGSRLTYAAFEHSTWLPWVRDHDWEIVTSNLDGSLKKRLTKNEGEDVHPVWSPDGTRIAFVPDSRVHVMEANGSNIQGLAPSIWVASLPPVWSPDGRSIAFLSMDRSIAECSGVPQRLLYTVGMDGNGATRVGHIVDETLPAWSPDGSRLVFSRLNECLVELHTVASDGDEPQTILEYPLGLLLNHEVGPKYGTSWSPDGRRILMGLFIVEVDGSLVRLLPTRAGTGSWSPDGSRIAVHSLSHNVHGLYVQRDGPFERLYTIAYDGSDLRILVEEDEEGHLSSANGRLIPS